MTDRLRFVGTTVLVCWFAGTPAIPAAMTDPAPAGDPKAPPTDANKSAEKKTEAPPAGKDKPPPPADDLRTPRQPTSDDILDAFRKDRPTNAPVRPRATREPGAAQDESTKALLLREGEYLYDESGRLLREGPWWTFVFESDSPEAPRPPMRVLPNQDLERMVMESEAASAEPLFLVSGEVTLFESANYLLIRKALRSRGTDTLRK